MSFHILPLSTPAQREIQYSCHAKLWKHGPCFLSISFHCHQGQIQSALHHYMCCNMEVGHWSLSTPSLPKLQDRPLSSPKNSLQHTLLWSMVPLDPKLSAAQQHSAQKAAGQVDMLVSSPHTCTHQNPHPQTVWVVLLKALFSFWHKRWGNKAFSQFFSKKSSLWLSVNSCILLYVLEMGEGLAPPLTCSPPFQMWEICYL